MHDTEQIVLELPIDGPVSWSSISRCAREAGVSTENWTFDALAAYIRMHERSIRSQQAEVWPPRPQERKRLPGWRLRLGNWLQRLADKCLDDGAEV